MSDLDEQDESTMPGGMMDLFVTTLVEGLKKVVKDKQ